MGMRLKVGFLLMVGEDVSVAVGDAVFVGLIVGCTDRLGNCVEVGLIVVLGLGVAVGAVV